MYYFQLKKKCFQTFGKDIRIFLMSMTKGVQSGTYFPENIV